MGTKYRIEIDRESLTMIRNLISTERENLLLKIKLIDTTGRFRLARKELEWLDSTSEQIESSCKKPQRTSCAN
jgi:hypothetical protein